MKKPCIAITMGDPSGVGPEIVVKTLLKWDIPAQPVVIGDRRVLNLVEEIVGASVTWGEGESTPFLCSLETFDFSAFRWGVISDWGGKASFEYIKKAVELAMKREIDAVVTAPINKESLHRAKVPFIGHTEILENLTRTPQAQTMFQVGDLRVFFLTRHLSLKDAVQRITKQEIISFLPLMVKHLKKLGIEQPQVAISALNPHAGEGGLLGEEEDKEIMPAIHLAREKGIQVFGPFPADSIFWSVFQNKNFDAVLSLYHDQGHIATKCLDFYGTVSVTLGLPFIRTSPDHGTAFDIAGRGQANPASLLEASRFAAQYAFSYQQNNS
ncbi:MAG: 4-phospho-D-threonate 3-dehydrogenase / 4-phospho-D-erythronate 3-dehydrogenase [Candidatus Atribacteria bacterium]|nr:4-phospho-D-threonate 3-dehydrogenase / 4-phospho-D-erythronate 3-dehydrogenase [Candidatus Atribacteria bacterium]